MTTKLPFSHLHVHSDYTLSRGASKVKDLVKMAVKLEQPALAIVDDSAMYGAMEFSKIAAEAGIQPIVGVKLWVDCGKGSGPDAKPVKGSIILLAQNEVGYATICTIVSMTHRPHDGQQGSDACVPIELFETTDFTGVFLLTGGTDGFLKRMIEAGRKHDGEEMLNWFRMLFNDRIYLEITRYGDETKEELDTEKLMIDIAYNAPAVECIDGVTRQGVPLIATCEAWYASENRHDAYEILKAVESKNQLKANTEGVVTKTTRRLHMRTTEEMQELFGDIPEAFENACLLPMRLHYLVKGRDPILPPFKTEGGRSENDELTAQAWEGLEERLALIKITGDARKPYEDRLKFELDIIKSMGFPGYFLIVSDFIKWAKANNIPVGPGRGSGAGSLVAYSLKITNLDPLKFGLLFERFLNPERVSMPDFDVDFCQDRRDEVIQYVVEKYGVDHVSLIATFGEIKSKTAISDVGRVMMTEEYGGYAFGELKRITKVVSMDGAVPATLEASYNDDRNPLFREAIDSEQKYRMLFENARKVEGLYRSHGSHAAGVIIGGEPLHTLVSVGWDDTKNLPVSQFNMKYSEAVGLVKFDFLGLKTLSVIQEALVNIKETTGEDINMDLISLEDSGTYDMLAEGVSNGVFQLESEGMKRVLRDIKPNRIEDLIAVVSLYRPGPMDMIPHYADCKNGKAEPEYPEPREKTMPFLEETFGIMVYQEQVMLVAQNVAGYSLGGADLLRRAMGKKIPAEMDAQRKLFVEGTVKNGGDAQKAEELFDLIAKFAGYGFNKSHAAAYALIAYHTAWLKRNYPAQFMAALLTYETDEPLKMAKVKEDMDLMGIPMLHPCVNHSYSRFKPEAIENGEYGIRFGFSAIKGISGSMQSFIDERKNGKFEKVEEFFSRCGAMFNKGQLERMVEAGAFDELSNNRNAAWNILSYLSKGGKKAAVASNDLFGGKLEIQVPHDVRTVAEWGNKVDREFMAVGFYFGQHPLDSYLGKLARVQVKRKASLKTFMQQRGIESLKEKRLAGMVDMVERRLSQKSGRYYIFAKFAEKNDNFISMFFGDLDKVNEIFEKLNNAKIGRRPVVVLADVALEAERDDLTLWGRDVFDADELIADQRGNMRITIDREDVYASPEEMSITRKALEAQRQGKATAKDVAKAELETKTKAIFRKAKEIKVLLEHMRDDENKNAIPISITLIVGEEQKTIALEGKYLVDMAGENAIKAMDGVVSVAEEIEQVTRKVAA